MRARLAPRWRCGSRPMAATLMRIASTPPKTMARSSAAWGWCHMYASDTRPSREHTCARSSAAALMACFRAVSNAWSDPLGCSGLRRASQRGAKLHFIYATVCPYHTESSHTGSSSTVLLCSLPGSKKLSMGPCMDTVAA